MAGWYGHKQDIEINGKEQGPQKDPCTHSRWTLDKGAK